MERESRENTERGQEREDEGCKWVKETESTVRDIREWTRERGQNSSR